jgi:hypothetical protein
MKKRSRTLFLFLGLLALCSVVLGTSVSAMAESIYVPNASFESPTLSPGGVVAMDGVGTYSWICPDYAGMGYPAGIFNNNPAAPYGSVITNQDGSNMCFFMDTVDPAIPAAAQIFQDLTATYEVGKSYTFTMGIARRLDEPNYDTDTLELRLFCRNTPGLILAATPVTKAGLSYTALTDYTVTIPTVQATDSWANQPMGIWICETQGVTWGSPGGAWTLDNVRLTATAVPEPTSLCLLIGVAIGGLVFRYRRCF